MNNDIKNAINTGIKKGKRARRTRMIVNVNIIVLAFVMVAFSVSINLSGALAASLKDVPVIGNIVAFVRIGSGYEDVAKRGYYTDGDVLISDGKFTIAVEGYYFSDHNINIVLSMGGDMQENHSYNIKNVRLYDTSMNELSGHSIGYGPFGGIGNNDKEVSNITVIQKEGILPDDIIITFDITDFEQIQSELTDSSLPEHDFIDINYIYKNLSVTLTKQALMENIAKKLENIINVGGISISLKELLITPVTMDLTCKITSENMQFYGFKDIYLKSDSIVYRGITNGVTSSRDPVTMDYIYYFDSSYFYDTLPLTLVIDGIYALPKTESSVIIDVVENKLIKSIDDNLKFDRIEQGSDEYFYIYFIGKANQDIGFSQYNNQIFVEIMESQGKEQSEYILKCEKRYIIDSKIEIEFWQYPKEIAFYKEIQIK